MAYLSQTHLSSPFQFFEKFDALKKVLLMRLKVHVFFATHPLRGINTFFRVRCQVF